MSSYIPAEFSEITRQALKHLYDLVQLQRVSLSMGRHLPSVESLSARQVQVEVVKAVDQLRPAANAKYLATEARHFNLVHGHYIEGLSIDQVARENAISARQAHRDLRRAEEAVSQILWETFTGEQSVHLARQGEGASVDEEIAALRDTKEPFDIVAVIQSACDTVAPLLSRQGITLKPDLGSAGVRTNGGQTVAQQFLVSLLSGAAQHAQPGSAITIGLERHPSQLRLRIGFAPQPNHLHGAVPLQSAPLRAADKLAHFLGWQIETQTPGQIEVVALSSSRRVLVVDDNEGLIDLMSHYLRAHDYEVFGCKRSQDAVASAQSLQPTFMILDVMMPGQDGWQVLKGLRENEATRSLPVVICSVFEDRLLAQSLDARHYLVKPVTRQSVAEILEAMNRGD